jgi:uncharacterized membrane protein YeaQ/YmgE (transglycosylase-associated protein family)
MTATALIVFLLIGAIAGWLAGLIVRGFGFGLLGNIVVGIIGAFLAGWLLPMLGIGFSLGSPIVTSIVYAMIGAIVLLVLIGLIKRAGRSTRFAAAKEKRSGWCRCVFRAPPAALSRAGRRPWFRARTTGRSRRSSSQSLPGTTGPNRCCR